LAELEKHGLRFKPFRIPANLGHLSRRVIAHEIRFAAQFHAGVVTSAFRFRSEFKISDLERPARYHRTQRLGVGGQLLTKTLSAWTRVREHTRFRRRRKNRPLVEYRAQIKRVHACETRLNVLPGGGEIHGGEKGESAPHGKPPAIRRAGPLPNCQRKKRAVSIPPRDLRFLRKDLSEENLHMVPGPMICFGVVSDPF